MLINFLCACGHCIFFWKMSFHIFWPFFIGLSFLAIGTFIFSCIAIIPSYICFVNFGNNFLTACGWLVFIFLRVNCNEKFLNFDKFKFIFLFYDCFCVLSLRKLCLHTSHKDTLCFLLKSLWFKHLHLAQWCILNWCLYMVR